MNILYDHQIFLEQKFGGISRYFYELMQHLPVGYSSCNSITYSENEYLRKGNIEYPRFTLPDFRGKGRIIKGISNFRSKRIIEKGEFDLFHPTYYDPYFLSIINKPYVITVYDMIHEKFPHFLDQKTIDNKRETITKANRIIAISENTKKDLIDLYGLDDSKIDVVHLGHSINSNQAEIVPNLPYRYILFVGQRGGYKNFENYTKACSIIHAKHPDIHFICTGKNFTPDETKLISQLGLSDVMRVDFVSDSQLSYLYKNAICFVYPSLYEGFGIPILESFASQCPLVLSNTSCFPEIAKDGGAYFDPYEVDSIAQILIEVIEDEKLRENLINKGSKILSDYSWEKMGVETADVYKKVIING